MLFRIAQSSRPSFGLEYLIIIGFKYVETRTALQKVWSWSRLMVLRPVDGVCTAIEFRDIFMVWSFINVEVGGDAHEG